MQKNPEEIIKKIKGVIDKPEILDNLNLSRYKKDILYCLENILNHIDNLTNNKDVNISDVFIKKSLSILRVLRDYIFLEKIDNSFINFTDDYLFLFINLLNNINIDNKAKESFEIEIKKLNLLISQRKTMEETIHILKSYLYEMRNRMNYEPSAFKIAKHYLDYLNK